MNTEKNILVIEDEDDLAVLLSKRLRSEGYAVSRVSDGVQALQQVRRLTPSLSILDLMLPGGGGRGVLVRLTMSVLTNDIPVLVLTGMQDPDYKEKVLEKGVDGYLQKPYDPVELLTEIKRLIGEAS